jgi:hypothetical protein
VRHKGRYKKGYRDRSGEIQTGRRLRETGAERVRRAVKKGEREGEGECVRVCVEERERETERERERERERETHMFAETAIRFFTSLFNIFPHSIQF